MGQRQEFAGDDSDELRDDSDDTRDYSNKTRDDRDKMRTIAIAEREKR